MNKSNSKILRYWINVVIGLAFMFLFPLLPPIGSVTEVGMSVLGIFIGMVYMWATVDGIWPELVGMVLIGLCGYVQDLTGYSAVKAVFTNAFGSETVIVVVLCMFLFSAIEGVGLTKYIARFFMTRKIMEGRPYVLLGVFLIGSYFISGTCGALVSMFMLWPIAIEICKKCGYERGDKFFYVIICGVYLAATIGQPMIPFKGAILAVITSLNNAFGVQINGASYLVYNVIMALIMFAVYLLIVRFIIRPDVEALKSIKIEDIVSEDIEKMNISQKIVLFIMAATIVCVMAPMILPTTIPGIGFLDTIGLLGIDCFLIAIAMMLKNKENKPMINLKEYAKKAFSWDIYFQVAAALYVATAITSDVTGIKTFVVETITALLRDKPVIIFIALIVICAVLVTQVANNMAMGIIFASLLSGFTAEYPTVNLIALAVTTGMAVFMALLTPAASPYCSMLHARKDLVSSSDIMKVFIPTAVLGIIVYICVGYPIASLIFR